MARRRALTEQRVVVRAAEERVDRAAVTPGDPL
jgi:hypothetical protein